MVKERGNDAHLFSPLADADSLANFFLKLQRWPQAVFAGLEEDKVKQDQKILGTKGKLSGTGGCDLKRGRTGKERVWGAWARKNWQRQQNVELEEAEHCTLKKNRVRGRREEMEWRRPAVSTGISETVESRPSFELPDCKNSWAR